MNILFINYYKSDSGGASYSTRYLIESLMKKGNNVFLLSREKYKGINTFIMKDIRFLPLFFLRDLYLKRLICEIVKKEKIDIIHCADGRFSVFASVLAAQKSSVPVVLHFRDFWFNCLKGNLLNSENEICEGLGLKKCLKCTKLIKSPWEIYKYYYFKKRLKIIDQADARIVVSNSVKEIMKKGGIKKKIDVVNNPVKFNLPKDANEDEKINFPNTASKTVVAYIGNLYYHKGIKTIMKVADKVSKKNKDIFFLIVGDGNMKKYCEDYIEKKKLSNVNLVGKIDHSLISELYKKSDIMFLPSLWPETFSRSVIESMFYGVPVIASGFGGNREIINSGYNGYLVDPNDYNECVDKIMLMANDEKLRKNISEKAARKVREFNVEIVSEKVLNIYNKIRKNE